MTSVGSMPKQSNGHFIILSSLVGSSGAPCVLTYTAGSGSGASATVGSFANASWAAGSGALAPYQLLKDMGMTVMSSGRMFRKIAPMTTGTMGSPYKGNDTVSFGVSTNTSNVALTGFIELGYEGFGSPTPVARYNSL